MRRLAIFGSSVALGLTVVPAVLVFLDAMTWQTHASLMTAGMIVWFVTAPFWMKKD